MECVCLHPFAAVAGVRFGKVRGGHRARWAECCRTMLVRIGRITQQSIRRGTFGSAKGWLEKVDLAKVEPRWERISGTAHPCPRALILLSCILTGYVFARRAVCRTIFWAMHASSLRSF